MMVLDPTVVWRNPLFYFFSGGELNQPKMNMILTLASKKHIVGTEILGFLVGVTEETSDTTEIM